MTKMNKNEQSKSLKRFYLLHQEKIKLIAGLVLVCLFAMIEWHFDNRFYAIFIICFYIIALFFRKKRYFDIIIPVILTFCIFNTLLPDCILLIKKTNVPSIQHPKGVLVNLFAPNTGLEVLPVPVQDMLRILKKTNKETYKLSPEISSDGEIMQRIVEAAWPRKLEETSPYIFINSDESDQYKLCEVVDDLEDLTLVDCH
jgi:hypothetical protein